MKKDKTRRQRMSLVLPVAGIFIATLLVMTVLASIIVALLIYTGVLEIGITPLNVGSFVLSLVVLNTVIGIVLAALLGNVLLKPVNKILNALNGLASGDFSQRLEFRGWVSRNLTIQELTDSFNTMARELEQTEMLRSDFIDNFSHEFKTPIVSIAGFAKLLKKGNLSRDEEKEYLDIIESESLRLSSMATNVLNMTRVENQEILTDVTEYNLSEQIRACVLLLEDKWSRKNLELILDFKEHQIRANEEFMKEVWVNLLDNAVKFTPDYGLIEVAITDEGETLSVAVVNSGKPIPEESLERIFQKFYQADESHATEGNGIGLAIVRKVVDLHKGNLSVESQEGRTAFTVTLPKGEGKEIR